MSRRLRLAGALGFCLLAATAEVTAQTPPRTGTENPGLNSVDEKVVELMRRYALPGGAIALAVDGKLLHARGFGYADLDKKEPVQPDSLFRIGSLSKPITAAAVLKLIEQRKLNIDARLFEMFPQEIARAPASADPRLRQISLRHLLLHSGGWDKEAPGRHDPFFRPLEALRKTGEAGPPTCLTYLRSILDQPLDFAPGQRFAYSNVGYCMLGRAIESAAGQSYESFVQQELLRPAGITRMRIARSLPSGRAPGEVVYYGHSEQQKILPAVAGVGGLVPPHYGGYALESFDAAGGWIASAVDLARFASALEGKGAPRIVSEPMLRDMLLRPAHVPPQEPTFYAKGWNVRPSAGGLSYWHHGSLDGTESYLARLASGVIVAFVANSRPRDYEAMMAAIDRELPATVAAVRDWPPTDQFPKFYPTNRVQ